jgi:predicted RNA-binding Zn ribbon-like protein
MQSPPDSPFPTGEPYWHWLGGRPAMDLVNTCRERGNRCVDCLVDDADVVRWLVMAGLLEAEGPPAPRGLATATRARREAVDAGVRAAAEGEPPPASSVELIDGWLAHATSRSRLVAGANGLPRLEEPQRADSPRLALGAVALDAARMLGQAEERDRLRICASLTCSVRFYDRSPGAGRRWCAMSGCGNLEKARRLRARRAR